jgi:hypothetical protein
VKIPAREEPIGEIRRNVDISDLLAKLPRPYEALKGDSEYFDEHQEELVELYPDSGLPSSVTRSLRMQRSLKG